MVIAIEWGRVIKEGCIGSGAAFPGIGGVLEKERKLNEWKRAHILTGN